MDWDILTRLMNAFPKSYIYRNGEFIAHKYANEYFDLKDCKSEIDVKCKVLEWLSRGACKTQPYTTKKKNNEFHLFMRGGINDFLQHHFSEADMEIIYDRLGNRVNHDLTKMFVLSGYDMSLLKESEE